jgi:perosamine synthetase
MINVFEPYLNKKEIVKNINYCIKNNWISSQGKFVKEFEKSLANYHSIKYCISTSSCTTALHLAIKSLGLKKGDEIICPSLTFIAPANMIVLSGAKLVLVDIDKDTLTLDPKKIEKKITNKTKAILVVHQFGHAAHMDEIKKISKKFKLKIIEDNAESLGGSYKNKKLGTIGDVTTLSFYANKIITTGEGGAILTNSKKIAEKCEILRDHGMSKKHRYVHLDLGYNYRMTNLQAAVGLSQIKNLNKILNIREKQLNFYEKKLSNNPNYEIRKFAKWTKKINWLITIFLKNSSQRKNLISYLKKKNIEVRPMIFPVNEAKHFKKEFKSLKFPIAKNLSYSGLHLPSSTKLSKRQIEFVVGNLNNFFLKRK